MNVEKIMRDDWIFYRSSEYNLEADKCGKWTFFYNYNNIGLADDVCKRAVENGIVLSSKYKYKEFVDNKGVACFYLNCDDTNGHKKVIKYFIENKLIEKTKDGRFYNISFKNDSQTRSGVYGDDFQSDIRLKDFIDLYTGEWL